MVHGCRETSHVKGAAAKACEAYPVSDCRCSSFHQLRFTIHERRVTQLSPYRPFHIGILEHGLARRRISPTDSVVPRASPVLHNYRVDQLAAGHATPGANVIE